MKKLPSDKCCAIIFSAGCLLLAVSPASALTVTVDPVNGTAVPLNASVGEIFDVSATGEVNLSGLDGPYTVNPDGMIVVSPPATSGSYNFWYGEAPVGVPAVGDTKYAACCAPVPGAAYGALIGEWTGGSWFLIGSEATIVSPSNGGGLTLWVNDTNYPDNLGNFEVKLTESPVSAAPEPDTWIFMIVGISVVGSIIRWSNRGHSARPIRRHGQQKTVLVHTQRALRLSA